MDAIKLMTEYRRMCTSYERCADCPLYVEKPCSEMPSRFTKEFASNLINAINTWSAAHPLPTRQDIFKKTHPNAAIDPFGSLYICPCDLNTKFECEDEISCVDCRRQYWLKEVEE